MAKRKLKPEPDPVPELVCSWCGSTTETIKRHGGGEIKITVEIRMGIAICNTCLNGITPRKTNISKLYDKDESAHLRWEKANRDRLPITKVVVYNDHNGAPWARQPKLGKSESEKSLERSWRQFLKSYDNDPNTPKVQRFPNSKELEQVLIEIRDSEGHVESWQRAILDKHRAAIVAGNPIL